MQTRDPQRDVPRSRGEGAGFLAVTSSSHALPTGGCCAVSVYCGGGEIHRLLPLLLLLLLLLLYFTAVEGGQSSQESGRFALDYRHYIGSSLLLSPVCECVLKHCGSITIVFLSLSPTRTRLPFISRPSSICSPIGTAATVINPAVAELWPIVSPYKGVEAENPMRAPLLSSV